MKELSLLLLKATFPVISYLLPGVSTGMTFVTTTSVLGGTMEISEIEKEAV